MSICDRCIFLNVVAEWNGGCVTNCANPDGTFNHSWGEVKVCKCFKERGAKNEIRE